MIHITTCNSSILMFTISLSLIPYFIAAFFTPSLTANPILSSKRNFLLPRLVNDHNGNQRMLRSWSPSGSVFDEFEEFKPSDSSEKSNSSNMKLHSDLRARQAFFSNYETNLNEELDYFTDVDNMYLQRHEKRTDTDLEFLSNWKNAQCTSTIRLAVSDWIRRISIDSYPLAVCGSADGSIYLADLESGEELDHLPSIHLAQIDDANDIDGEEGSLMAADAMQQLYGMHDGGGVISIAVHNDIVVSSGREGGVRLFAISSAEELYKSAKLKLNVEGKLSGSDSTIITSMAFDDTGTLWTGGYDGVIRGYECDNREVPLTHQNGPIFEMDTGSKVLSISVNNKIGAGVAATTSGNIFLFSTEDGSILAKWRPFGKWNPFDKPLIDGRWKKREYARSAIIIQNDRSYGVGEKKEAVWSIVCGGSEGTMYQRRLNVDRTGFVSEEGALFQNDLPAGRMQPTHSGPVVALASPMHGLLISGSQDGTMRVWDSSYQLTKEEEDLISLEQEDESGFDSERGRDRRPRCLYALTGYKEWFGSIFTNGNKLVSDGADNTIVVHDFSGKGENDEGSLCEGEEEDEMEGYSFE